jgi:uncharacterized protein YukE
MKTIKIKNNEIVNDIVGKIKEFPKYTTQIINLSNQNAQGTRPKIVGQMSELIQQFKGNSIKEWEKWYKDTMPGAIDKATERIYGMIEQIKDATKLITKDMVKDWVEDLVINKTYIGLKFQESILKRVANSINGTWRLALPNEESKGIDGFINDKPISIKPITYKTMNRLRESIDIDIIFYEKKKDGITVEYNF